MVAPRDVGVQLHVLEANKRRRLLDRNCLNETIKEDKTSETENMVSLFKETLYITL